MIQDCKEELVARLDALTLGIHLTDSEVDAQPTANSPLFQLKFVAETTPEELQGFGDPGHFRYGLKLLGLFKATGPDPDAHRELYRKWLTVSPITGQPEGLKIALHQLVANGFSAGGYPWLVTIGETSPGPLTPGYTACLQIPIALTTAFAGS